MIKTEYGLSAEDLYRRQGLARLDGVFLGFLAVADPDLKARLEELRRAPESVSHADSSALMLALAAKHHELAPLYACKRLFVQRRAMRKLTSVEAEALDGEALEARLTARLDGAFDELALEGRHRPKPAAARGSARISRCRGRRVRDVSVARIILEASLI